MKGYRNTVDCPLKLFAASIGGAADLAPSTKTTLTFDGADTISAQNPGGRNLHFGVREHAMGAIVNGLVLSHLRAFGATFLIFSDYMRPSIRLAALMKLPVFHVFTHDSIGVGEDGPTHQPIEQLAGLRAIPNMIVLRPADASEVREAYRVIMTLKDQPAMLALSRQPLPIFDRGKYAKADVAHGAYVLADADNGQPEVILIGTGSDDTMTGSDLSSEYRGLFTDRIERYQGNEGSDFIDGGSTSWGDFDLVAYNTSPVGVVVNLGPREQFYNGFEFIEGGTANDGFIDTLSNVDGVVGFSECVADEEPSYSAETVKTVQHALEDFIAPIVFRSEYSHPDDFLPTLRHVRGHNMAKAAVEMGLWEAYARARGDGKTMQEKLANELLDAANLRGGAVKKREDTHRMAEANKAFAHYRW